jgi:hypothetical protein
LIGKFEDTDVNEIWYSDKVPTGYDWVDNDADVVKKFTCTNVQSVIFHF